jgi:hypothetical protein
VARISARYARRTEEETTEEETDEETVEDVEARAEAKQELREATDADTTDTTDTTEEEDTDTSIADLVGQAEPEVFDRTFLVEKEDLPAATDNPWPVPQPWQGIPRLAFVVNLNYVYDEENGEWVRQGPFRTLDGVRVKETDSITVTATDGNLSSGSVDDADASRPYFISVNPVNPSNVPDFTEWYEGDIDDVVSGEVVYRARYVFDGTLDVTVANESGVDLDVTISIYQPVTA